jgi:MFS family permease
MTFKELFRIPPALKHRRFALLWAGLLISTAGSQMQVWAIYWHLRDLSTDPIVVSGIGVAKFLPILAFALVGGLAADTFNRRGIVFITQIMMTLIATGLGLLTAFGHVQLWQIYIMVAIQGIAVSFDGPARQSMIPSLVAREDLRGAFGLQSIAADVGAVIGPALSGLVIATLGLQWTYWINAISFLAVILALILMGPVETVHSIDPRKQLPMYKRMDFSGIPVGIRFILGHPIILSSMILDFFATFFASANTLLPYFSQYILHIGEVAYGWLAAAPSIGAVVVGLIISQFNNIRRQGQFLIVSVLIFGLATIFFGFSRLYAVIFLALVVTGAADSVSTIIRNTIRNLNTPDSIRGRMTGVNQIFFMGGPQLGEIEAGAAAQGFGVPFAIISGGVGTILIVILIAAHWPILIRYNGDEPIRAGAPAD